MLVYGMADGHEPFHMLREDADIYFDAMKLGEKYNRTSYGKCYCGGLGRLGV